MLAVILSGHGAFASGLAQAVHQVIGEQPQFRFIDFPEQMTTPQLDVAMRQAMDEIDTGMALCFSPIYSGVHRFAPLRCLAKSVLILKW